MQRQTRLAKGVVLGLLLGLFAGAPLADDTEIYVGNLNTGNVSNLLGQPNILFIVDTSGSMKANVDSYDYISGVTYSGGFVSDSVYWSQSGAVITDPTNADTNVIDAANFHCQAAQPSFDSSGSYFGATVAWDPTTNLWSGLDPLKSGLEVECQGDDGVHGSNAAPTPNVFASNGANGPWGTVSDGQVVWQNQTLYSGNYLNWNSLANKPLTGRNTRLGIVQRVVFDLVNSANNINIALMRFDSNSNGAEGGMVRSAMENIVASRAGFIGELAVLEPGGGTPLSEVLYEAARYFRGEGVVYGINSNARVSGNDVLFPSVGLARLSGTNTADPDSYISPIKFECQKSSLVFLTDGSPTSDGGADSAIQSLPGFSTVTGQTTCNGNCLDELAEYLNLGDQSSLPDSQNVITYTIGFAFGDQALLSQEDQDALLLLQDTATKGGGAYFSADDTQGLKEAFAAIISDIRAAGSTFTAPTVPINAANRSRHRNELYMTMFKPSPRPRWDGNLKKYTLAFDPVSGDPMIVDANNVAAIDALGGELLDTAKSYWSTTMDGKDVVKGGFSSRLSLPRNMYTYSNAAVASNVSLAAITGEHFLNESNQARLLPYLNMLATDVNPTPSELLQWARGVDVKNEFDTLTAPGPRLQVSDPLHSQPTVITYTNKTALFFTTNSGYLHVADDSNGSEIFSFMPQELLSNLRTLYINNSASNRIYGLDGSVQAWVDDGGDGKVDLADKAYIYFGMRRGGRNYYALDVTNPAAPVLKWTIKGGAGVFAELGQSWSDPVIKTIKYNGVATKVLIFSGGYDPLQDSAILPTADTQGRAIYIVNAETGQRIWWAGPSGSGADLVLADMTNSIPSKVNAIDLEGDGLTDRIYVGDTKAQMWRFDLNPNNTSAADLMTGGVIAKLGGVADVDNRRFYYPPDISLIASPGQSPYLAILTASGYRAHPLNNTIQDRIYMIKDKYVYAAPTPASYLSVTEGGANPITPATQLVDTTANLVGQGTAAQRSTASAAINAAQGWYIRLQESNGSYVGEKGLSTPLIVDGQAVVTTYAPIASTVSACSPGQGQGYAYFLNIANGTPTIDQNLSGDFTLEDRRKGLLRSGIPPAPGLLITDQGTTGIIGNEFFSAGSNEAKKTYWHEN